MKNMMKEYLGNDYSSDHLRNFCLYWMKGAACRKDYPSDDAWRSENDLDCLTFDGDLHADTLMSAWTPIKWVADCLNRDLGIKFHKSSKHSTDPEHDLKLLAEEGDLYLDPSHRLVTLLNRFLKLAEERCNFILLPSREMNPARYRSVIRNRTVWLCDEVPSTLAHLYDKDSLGRFFLGENGEVDEDRVRDWIYREHLEPGFERGIVDRGRILPLLAGRDPYEPVWPTGEDEIAEALTYMIEFLSIRREILADPDHAGCYDTEDRGSVAYSASARGKDRIPRAIEEAFRGITRNETPDRIAQIDLDIVCDLPTAESAAVDRCIRRLCNWYGKDGMIPYGYKYTVDTAQPDVCRVDAILHLKKDHRLLPDRWWNTAAHRVNGSAPVRPEGITSNVLWELYQMFLTRSDVSLWVNTDKSSRGTYRLYTAREATLGHGETDYGVDSMGIELPWSRMEWIDLSLVPSDSGSILKTRITTDALYESNVPVEALLDRNHMRLA